MSAFLSLGNIFTFFTDFHKLDYLIHASIINQRFPMLGRHFRCKGEGNDFSMIELFTSLIYIYAYLLPSIRIAKDGISCMIFEAKFSNK